MFQIVFIILYKLMILLIYKLLYKLCALLYRQFREQEEIFNNIYIFPYINQPDALIFQIYFGKKTLHVSDSSSVHLQELFTVHSAMVYVIQVCRQLSITAPDDGHRNCPKYVDFLFQNKF
jgi:hypothetical protein